MKRTLLFLIIFLAIRTVSAQEIVAISEDPAAVPEVKEQQFYNFNPLNKLRLDSITNTVPLTYNEFVQQYIDVYTRSKSMIGKMLGLSDYYFPIFEKALQAYNIPEEIKYLPIIESKMDPVAVSKHGATGLWQFMFATAKGYGLSIDNFEDQRRDPVRASYAAAAYFRDAYEELGDWLLALAAYNCGKGNVTRAIDKAGSRDFWEIRPYLPQETRNYVPAFIAAVYAMKYADMNQIVPQKSVFTFETDTVLVNRFVALPELASAMQMDEELLLLLNPSYKRKIVNGTMEISKRIILPKLNASDYAAVYEVLNNSHVETDRTVVQEANDDRRLSVKNKKKAVEAVKPLTHKVKPGENLTAIADLYHVTLQDLKVWNALKSNTIVPGQQLKVTSKSSMPAATTVKNTSKTYITYKVKRGDTLSEIAERFDGATVSGIKKDNNLPNAKLQEGMLLKIFKG